MYSKLLALLFALISTLFFAINLSGCASNRSSLWVSQYGNRPIYPAVIYLFQLHQIPLEKIDVFAQTFETEYLYTHDPKRNNRSIRYKLRVNKSNELISITPFAIAQKNPIINNWFPLESSSPILKELRYLAIPQDISLILNDSSIYQQVKSKVHANLFFNFAAMSELTDLGKERWIKKHMAGQTFQLSLPLSNFKRNENRQIKKKYIATFKYRANNDKTSVNIEYYTNSDQYADMKKRTMVHIKGTLLKSATKIVNNRYTTIALMQKE